MAIFDLRFTIYEMVLLALIVLTRNELSFGMKLTAMAAEVA